MKLTVSMITMNEERAVAKVVDDIRRVAPDAEILIVDSSADRTAEIAEEMGCRVIKQFPPRGYGPAMDRAVREASGEVVITLDCDDTYPVDAIPRLVALIEEGYDLVNTTRTWRRPEAMPLANYLANRVFALGARVLHGLRTTDVHSGMRAYRKSMIDALSWDPHGPALPVDMYVIPLPPRISGHGDPHRLSRTDRRDDAAPLFEHALDVSPALARAKGEARVIPVAILCGGLGTRLGRADEEHPQADDRDRRPPVSRASRGVVRRHAGCRDVVMLTGHRAE